MRLPRPRGPVSALLIDALSTPARPLPGTAVQALPLGPGLLADEDLQLALTVCYELHYRGFDGVDERWEWEPSLLGLRAALEREFERQLRALAQPAVTAGATGPDRPVDAALRQLLAADDSPSLSTFVRRRATLDQVREVVIHRSIYQLKEADPHTWGIPRLAGRPKAALIEIQLDEYGGGRPERMHAALFADTMRALGLDDTYGAYLDAVPASTLATVNLISLFGLHRRWRGALLGHLAVFEMTSAVPARRYGDGLRRLGFGRAATEFYDEHVAADAVHEQVAAVDMCGSFVATEPDPGSAAGQVLFGAACCLAVEAAFAGSLLDAWGRGKSSLRSLADQHAGSLARRPLEQVAGGRVA